MQRTAKKKLQVGTSLQGKPTRFDDCAWRIHFCGIFCNPQEGSESEAVIYRHQKQHPVFVMCRFFEVSRSDYYNLVKRMSQPEKDATLFETIRQQQDKRSYTYDYRPIWQWLKSREEIHHNLKTILRVMQKYGLLAEIRRSKKWQQMGQHLHKYQKLLNRNFRSEAPNRNG